jgi:hypothetical protein
MFAFAHPLRSICGVSTPDENCSLEAVEKHIDEVANFNAPPEDGRHQINHSVQSKEHLTRFNADRHLSMRLVISASCQILAWHPRGRPPVIARVFFIREQSQLSNKSIRTRRGSGATLNPEM